MEEFKLDEIKSQKLKLEDISSDIKDLSEEELYVLSITP